MLNSANGDYYTYKLLLFYTTTFVCCVPIFQFKRVESGTNAAKSTNDDDELRHAAPGTSF